MVYDVATDAAQQAMNTAMPNYNTFNTFHNDTPFERPRMPRPEEMVGLVIFVGVIFMVFLFWQGPDKGF
jgi:hypothetical protein